MLFSRKFFFVVMISVIAGVAATVAGAQADVKFDAFDKQSLSPVFAGAERVSGMDAWQKAVTDGLNVQSALWEQDAEHRIETAVSGLAEDERDQERSRLKSECAVARQRWESDAIAEISRQRIAKLSRDAILTDIKLDSTAIRQALQAAEAATGTNFNEALDSWDGLVGTVRTANRLQVQTAISNNIAALATKSGLSGAELEIFVKGLEQRATGMFLDWDMSADYLIVRQRNKWVATKLYDRSSLRRESELQTAERIVSDVIQTTGEKARKDFNDALSSQGAIRGETPADTDLSQLGADWQLKLQNALSTGLAQWDKAASEVLRRFGEWRTNALEAYAEQDKLWGDAYAEIKTAREAWQQKAMDDIKAGLDAWEKKKEEAITNRQVEEGRLNTYVNEQQQQWTDYAGQLSSLFSRGGDAVKTAMENLNWIGTAITDTVRQLRYYGNKFREEITSQAFFMNEFLSWVEACKASWTKRTDKWSGEPTITLLSLDTSAILSGHYYVTVNVKYHAYLTRVDTGWWNADEHAVCDNSYNHTYDISVSSSNYPDFLQAFETYQFYTNEQARWNGILTDFNSLNNATLYAYQHGDMLDGPQGISLLDDASDAYLMTGAEFALEQQKRQLEYYKDRLAVSKAVLEYATNLGAGRESAEETKRKYDAALKALTLAEADYSNARIDLNIKSSANLATWKTNLTLAGQDLASARTTFEKAKTTYDGILYQIRLMQNCNDADGIAMEMRDNLKTYESARLSLAGLQSNYSMNLARLSRYSDRAAYANVILASMSNVESTYQVSTRVGSILGGADAANPVSVTNAANSLLKECVATFGVDYKKELCDFLRASLGTLVAKIISVNASPADDSVPPAMILDVLSLMRAIGRDIEVQYETSTNGYNSLLHPESDYSDLSSRRCQLEYDACWQGLNNEHATAEFLADAAREVLAYDTVEKMRTEIDARIKASLSGYLLSAGGKLADADKLLILERWFVVNRTAIEDAVGTPGKIDALLTSLDDRVDELADLVDGFPSSFFWDDQMRADAARNYVSAACKFSDEAFTGIASFSYLAATGHFAFVSDNAGTLGTMNLPAIELLVGQLKSDLSNPSLGATDTLLLANAEKIIEDCDKSGAVLPMVVSDAINSLRSALDLARKKRFFLDYGLAKHTHADATADLSSLTSESNANAARVELGKLAISLLGRNDFATVHGLIADAKWAQALSGDAQKGLLECLREVKDTSKDQAIKYLTAVLNTASSNISDAFGNIQFAISAFIDVTLTESFRGFLGMISDTKTLAISTVISSASSDTVKPGVVSPSNSKFIYVLVDGGGSSSTAVNAGNSYLDSLNSLADVLSRLAGGMLPVLEKNVADKKNDWVSLQSLAKGAFDGKGVWKTGSAAFRDNAKTWQQTGLEQNFENDSDFATAKSSLDSTWASIESTAADLIRQGLFYVKASVDVADYMLSKEVVDAKDELKRTTEALSASQNRYGMAQTGYATASSDYYAAMHTVVVEEAEYLSVKKNWDKASAIYAYATSPYREAEKQVSATIAGSDVRTDYLRAESVCSNANWCYQTALSNLKKEASISVLNTDARYLAYRNAREDYAESTSSWIRLDKAVTDIGNNAKLLTDSLNRTQEKIDSLENSLFNPIFLGNATNQEFLGQVRLWMRNSHYPVQDFYDWVWAGCPATGVTGKLFTMVTKPGQIVFMNNYFTTDHLNKAKQYAAAQAERLRLEAVWKNHGGKTYWLDRYYQDYRSACGREEKCRKALVNETLGLQDPRKFIDSLQSLMWNATYTQASLDYTICKQITDSTATNSAPLASAAGKAAMLQLQSGLCYTLANMKLAKEDYALISGASGLTNLANWMADKVQYRLVRPKDMIDELGNVVSGKYEYVFDISKLLELLRSKESIARSEAMLSWQTKAALAKVDNTIFLRDREGILYTAATNSASVGQQYEAFKTVAAELVNISTEAWGLIKQQESALQRQKWDFTEETLKDEQSRWFMTANDILTQGNVRWQVNERTYIDAWFSWKNESQEIIREGNDKWNRVQLEIAGAQSGWLQRYQQAASGASAEAIRQFLSENVNDVMASITRNAPQDCAFDTFDFEKLKADLIRDASVDPFSKEFMGMVNHANSSFSISEISAASGSAISANAEKTFGEYEKAAKAMQNMRLFETLNKIARSYEGMLDKAEDKAKDVVKGEMEKGGFKLSGEKWSRRAIYDANIWGKKWKTQYVPDWKAFSHVPFTVDLVVDGGEPFKESMLATMDQAEVDALVLAAKIGLKNKWKSIYEDATGTNSFQAWQGTPPSTNSANGKGQYGIIFSAKAAADMEKAAGEAKANAPFFKKSLIPGLSFSLFDLTKLAGSIVGGPWVGFALSAADTAVSVARGEMSLGDGLMAVAKSAATTAVGNFTGGLADSWGASLSQGLGSSVIGSTLGKLASTAVNQMANIGISGFNLQHGWSMDKNAFKAQMSGALKSMAITTSTALVSGIVNSANGAKFGGYTTPGGGQSVGWNISDSGVLNNVSSTMMSVGNLAGSISGQLASAAMGDGFSLNVLNSKDLGIGGNGVGLLEFTIGGKNSGFRYGQGGADVSYGAMSQFTAGLNELNNRANVRDTYGTDANAVLAQANMMRWSGNADAMRIANGIMGGEMGVQFGKANTSSGNMIGINRDEISYEKNGDVTMGSQMRLATLGAHEGMHVLDNQSGNLERASQVENGMTLGAARELAAYGLGADVWSGLTSKFGISIGSERDQSFTKEMQAMVAAKQMADKAGNSGAFMNYLNGNGYDMSGNDWRHVSSGNNQHNAVLDSVNTLDSLNIALQAGNDKDAQKAIVKGLLEKTGLNLEGMTEDMKKAVAEGVLKTMNNGQGLSLVYDPATGYTLKTGAQVALDAAGQGQNANAGDDKNASQSGGGLYAWVKQAIMDKQNAMMPSNLLQGNGYYISTPFSLGGHPAVDIAHVNGGDNAIGTPYYAPDKASVEYQYLEDGQDADRIAAGNMLTATFNLNGKNVEMNIMHLYADNDFKQKYQQGQTYTFEKGQVIGFWGNSGTPKPEWNMGSTYYGHGHVGLTVNGRPVNPLDYLKLYK